MGVGSGWAGWLKPYEKEVARELSSEQGSGGLGLDERFPWHGSANSLLHYNETGGRESCASRWASPPADLLDVDHLAGTVIGDIANLCKL